MSPAWRDFFPHDRRCVYSASLAAVGMLIYAFTHNGDLAILNVLGAIWFKMPWPDERESSE